MFPYVSMLGSQSFNRCSSRVHRFAVLERTETERLQFCRASLMISSTRPVGDQCRRYELVPVIAAPSNAHGEPKEITKKGSAGLADADTVDPLGIVGKQDLDHVEAGHGGCS